MEHLYCLCGHGQPGAKRGLGPFVERRLEDNEAMHGLNMIRGKFSANHRQSSNKVFVLIPDPCPITTGCTVCHLEANSFARLSVQSRVQQQQESVVEYFPFFSFRLPFLSIFLCFYIFVFLYFVFLYFVFFAPRLCVSADGCRL